MGTYRMILIPVATTLGGLISGLLVYVFAPEAEGHGTDAAIESFHFRKGVIRRRIPVIKLLASAVTIGSGGSAGREGPVAQIAAGFGSFVADVFKMTDRDRRIAVAAGIGAGIGSIFMAPFGGALLSTEVLYRRDFEVEALVPSIIASVTGYAVFGYFFNYQPLFSIPLGSVGFSQPISLMLYCLVGIVTGLIGILYVVSFYGIRSQFVKLKRMPNYLKPAIAGLFVGIIGIVFPQVLGLGYGWLQLIFYHNYSQFNELALMPIWILLALIFLKILATSLSIGSGGSGGVFAPGIVIGGFTGAVIWELLHPLFPALSLTDVVIVSMIAFFGGISKAPISVIIMGTEMTQGYALFLPLMLATVISYFVSGTRYSIYNMQVLDRSMSPAHAEEFEKPLMDFIPVKEAMNAKVSEIDAGAGISDSIKLMERLRTNVGLVMSVNEIINYVTLDELRKHRGDDESFRVRELPRKSMGNITSNKTAHDAFNMLTSEKVETLIVRDAGKQVNNVLGVIGLTEIAKAYNEKIREIQRPPSDIL